MSVHLERGPGLRRPLEKVSKVGHFSLFEREPAASVVRANLVSRVYIYMYMVKEMATHSSILAWEIPWTEEPDGLQSMGCKESDTT